MQHLAIIDTDDAGTINVVVNHGPCTNAEFNAHQTRLMQGLVDWDALLNGLLDFLAANNLLTETGLTTNGYTVWSVCDFIRTLAADLPKDFQDNPAFRIAMPALKTAMRSMKKGEKIELNMDDLQELISSLAEPLMRQLLRDADRRDRLRPVMPGRILLHENPPSSN